MGRRSKSVSGICRLCGKEKKLSFEHVPPESAFNNRAVKWITGKKIIDIMMSNGRLPWEINNVSAPIQQRGKGGFFLCEECNNNTGSWYVVHYTKFIYTIHKALSMGKNIEYKSLGVTLEKTRPLPIFKTIMTMFCDINRNCFQDEGLRNFMLNRESNNFDKKKYRIFAYLASGEVERMNGIFTIVDKNIEVLTISEITTYPVGYALYIDLPDNYKPPGCEITSFADYPYEGEYNIEIILPKLESNTIFPGDYRTKAEIIEEISNG